MRPASCDAGKGDAAASDCRAGDDGGAAAADDCNADATVAAEDGGTITTATDEPGSAGSSHLDVEQTIGLLLWS